MSARYKRSKEKNKDKKKLNFHPNSRHAKRLGREKNKFYRKQKKKSFSNMVKNIEVKKMNWFKDKIENNVYNGTEEEIHELIELYINRNDDEMYDCKVINSCNKKKPKATRLSVLEHIKQKELKSYERGNFFLVNLLDEILVRDFLLWNGNPEKLSTFEQIKFKKPTEEEKQMKFVENPVKLSLQKDVEIKLPEEDNNNNNEENSIIEEETMIS
eukprot:TRINITY_DN108803_c0_g1_i2.p1 TRINITY_DN108803_c0_g1~~TRINITY_DN108803_c0_g1_i2.p1  ORF type:complete len:214 (+),score=39.21 TRINITY_DN108803_c0_g1_i2:38-679(+)